jgi:hydroxymethylpyrimidine pyrophosphatase-like HAD family hydrolase
LVSVTRSTGFGDALNDLPMFSVVGFAVAMANAGYEVRARAGITTESVDDAGFAAHLAGIGLT